jgi:hypothetical protein
MDEYLSKTKRTARKTHTCAVPQGCDGTIRPGEDYFDEVSAPWTRIADDVSDEGVTLYTTLGEWCHSRTHVSCFNAWMDKFNREVNSGFGYRRV